MTYFYKNFSFAIMFSWLGTFFSSTLKLLRAPIIIYTIGLDEYGIWITIVLLMGIAINYENVISSIITKKISNSSETDIIKRILFIKVNDGIFNKLIIRISLGFGLIYFFVIQIIHIFSSSAIEYQYLLFHDVAAAISIILYLFGLKFVAYIDGIDNVHYGRLGKIFYEFFGFLLILSILYFDTIHILGFVLIIQSLGFCIFNINMYSFVKNKQEHQAENTEIKEVDTLSFNGFFKDSLRLISLQSGAVLFSMTPILLIPILFSYTESAQYALLIQLCQFANFLIMPILISFLPKLVHDVKNNNISDFIWIVNTAFLSLIIYFLFLQVYIESIIPLWIGEKYTLGNIFLGILSIGCLLDIYNQCLRQICLSLDLERFFNKIFINSTITFLSLLLLIIFIINQVNELFFILLPHICSITYVIFALFKIITKSSNIKLNYFKPKYIAFYAMIYAVFSIINGINWIFGFYTLVFSIIIYILYLIIIFKTKFNRHFKI